MEDRNADLNAPFNATELVGKFVWADSLARVVAPSHRSWLYTCCHLGRLMKYIRRGTVLPRSGCDMVAQGGDSLTLCSWWRVEVPHDDSYFGPYAVMAPLNELVGRRFYVFKRLLPNRSYDRVSLVQYVPPCVRPFSVGKIATDPATLFEWRRGQRPVQFEVLPTTPIPLDHAQVTYRGHRWQSCASGSETCSGTTTARDACAALGKRLGQKLHPCDPLALGSLKRFGRGREVIRAAVSNS